MKKIPISPRTVSKFITQLQNPDNTSRPLLKFPCIIVKTDQKDDPRVHQIHTTLIGRVPYTFYFFDCDDSEGKQITDALNRDIKVGEDVTNEFDLLIVDELGTASEYLHISFGTKLEIYEYVMNRTLLPDEKLYANIYTRRRWVSGLRSVSVLSNERHKIIILGEQHNKSDMCELSKNAISAFDFVLSLLEKNKRGFVDLYGEFPIQMEGKTGVERQLATKMLRDPVSNSFMMDLFLDLKARGCLYSGPVEEGKICSYAGYVRFHSTDVRRSTFTHVDLYFSVFSIWVYSREYSDSNDEPHKSRLKREIKYYCKRVHHLIKKGRAGATINVDIDLAINMLRINRQIGKMANDKEKEVMAAFCSAFLRKIAGTKGQATFLGDLDILCVRLVGAAIETGDEQDYGGSGGDHSTIIQLRDLALDFMPISVFLMDYYLMTRLLKGPYDIKKNSIIYVGDAHTAEYVKLLIEMEFKLVFATTTSVPRACLDLSDMLWPYV